MSDAVQTNKEYCATGLAEKRHGSLGGDQGMATGTMQGANFFWITCIKTGGAPVTYSAPDVQSIETKFAEDVLARLSNPFRSKKPVLLGHYGTYGSAQVTDAYMVSTGAGATVEYRHRVDPHHAQIVRSSHPPLPSARP